MNTLSVGDLAGYAVTDDRTRGRVHPEPAAARTGPFELDRHRIVHCSAFRRLEYKTQVFVTHEADHYRTRLTHTLETAHIARRLARGLRLNATLAEVIALAHDLGHPPFGHAGERALVERMAGHGGFEHNAQALRVVDYLEHPYPAFRGLNLSYEVRESLIKHRTVYDAPGAGMEPGSACGGWPGLSDEQAAELLATGPQPTLEAQVASVADRLAYDCHDLEDALAAGLVDGAMLEQVSLWADAAGPIRTRFADRPTAAIRRPVLDALLERLLADVVEASAQRIYEAGISRLEDVRACDRPVVGPSEAMARQLEQLEGFLRHRVYRHHRLVRMDHKARLLIERLFEAYLAEPALLPDRFSRRIPEQGAHRVICDYIAGMTDRFCQDEYKRLFEPFERV